MKRPIFWPLSASEHKLQTEEDIRAYYRDMARLMCLFLLGGMLILVAFGLRWMAYQ